MTLANSVVIESPLPPVWDHISDLRRHQEWMVDARSITFETPHTTGLGTRMSVVTSVGPLRTTDKMEVIAWEEGRSISVRHTGLITGEGSLRLDAVAGGTRVTWAETLQFPWYLGGSLTALAALPVLTKIWRQNLARLKTVMSRCPPTSCRPQNGR